MTVADAYSATASLGFERELEGGYEHFIPALNRAVRQVNELRPRVKCLPVMYSPPVYSNPHLEESVTVLGNFFVGDVFGSIVFYSGNKESKKISGRVNYNSPFDRFVLDGVARNVEVYTWTPALLDMTVYPDFDGLCHGDGTVVDTRNITEIWYKTKPQTFSLGDEGKYIELDDDLVQLLPLLLAAYLWLEDEAEKSAYYMNLYRERAASISRRMKCPDAFSFNGWG
jgi:hypothetical protein